MKIVLATPLYPPEIAEPGPYVKELARRLAGTHEVTVVAYTRLPEAIPGVRVVVVDKRRPLMVRLIAYFFALRETLEGADVLYFQNGPSVELPVVLVSFFTRARIVMRMGDTAAHAYAAEHTVRRTIEGLALSRSAMIVHDSPRERPEILPFEPMPDAALGAYETSWQLHLASLAATFRHG